MRDLLEDAHRHQDAGRGRAQAEQRPLPRRFYENVDIAAADGGFAVTLDGRPTRTPSGRPVRVPSAAIAEALAAEWAAQGERIDPETMPLVRLVNSAQEAGAEGVPGLQAEVVKYAASDLLLYRADSPRELVAEQERLWDGALVRLARHFGVGFQPTIGIVHQPQPPATLERLAEAIHDAPLLELVALVSITGITGSALLALAIRHGLLSSEEAWMAAHVDEDHNIRVWGAVEEATQQRSRRQREYAAAVRLLELLRT